ncbi:ANTAR domain-containing protein [Streptomyces sp. NPDC007205]|uniref:ANTAR domain-containing protein n=1 Tax=Streptomyces sp. NPDC007205 TaxID=3154316 RepID=UPI0033CFB6CA
MIAKEDPDLPQRLCVALRDALEGQGAALALMADLTHHHTLAASGDQAADLCQLEFDLGEGPGLHSVAHIRPVLVGDLSGADAERWPMWAATVAERGLPARAVFAFPLQISGTAFGLVELFRVQPGALDELDAAAARVAADLAALALAHSFDQPVDSLGTSGWAEEDLDSVEVDQAVGMVMAQLRAPDATALSMLRARAFAEGRRLGDVAQDVLTRKITFEAGKQGQE